MKVSREILIVGFAFSITGCSSFGIDGFMQNSRTIKAEERLLLVTDKANTESQNDSNSTPRRRVVCAEPSPDAMTALATSGSLTGSYMEQVDVSLAFAFSQSISELGERTPVIQMLRDSLYRACEANMNGLLSDKNYKDILNYFDIYSMTLLAIEDLTRSPRLSSVLNTNATVNQDKSLESRAEKPTISDEAVANSKKENEVTENSVDKKTMAVAVKDILCNYYNLKYQLWKLNISDGAGTAPAPAPATSTILNCGS